MKRITCNIALPALKIAVFDGCFWHRCDIHPSSVKKNTSFWMEKIERNRARDSRVRAHLAEIGWTTLRFWENEAVEAIVKKILSTVEQYRAAKLSPRGSARSLQNMKRAPGQFEAVDREVVSTDVQTVEQLPRVP
ncbi:hypothetical protein JJB09_25435 [Rhizobium sp. KVB221]|uniref:Very short patch repair endonuclease n=1 Tax=Rhizobium setariae TaxID=2801340 RepID=A0A936YT55_9HYPH|nr:hypothetical protein [Rhizobium setariae]MBL0375363.1 hypothetical protein [Rhizobium setariae]